MMVRRLWFAGVGRSEEVRVLTEVRLGDLKGWEGRQSIRLAPLNLFFGRNGSGKSTLIRAVCDKAAENSKHQKHDPPPRRGLRRGDRELEETLGLWLTRLGVVDDFSLAQSETGHNRYGLKVAAGDGETYIPVTRAGSGAQCALLVLVRVFASATEAPVHLDHPEGHLQPSAQSVLGDALLAAVKANSMQLLVETHSDRLLRRIRRRIAEGQITRNDVAVYLVDTLHGKTEIQELVIDEYGNVTNWPRDFFGEEMDDLAAMTEAAAERLSREIREI